MYHAERVRRPLTTILSGLVLGYLLVASVAFVRQRAMIYFPSRYGPPGGLPAEAVALGGRAVRLRAADGVEIEAWWFPPRSAVDPVLLQCHGNGGDVRGRLPWASVFVRRGLGVFLFDYRGYGASEGSPTERGLRLDAEAAYDFVRGEGIEARRLVVLGESLGGGPAAHLAATRPLGGLILESTFTSAVDRAREAYPWLPVGLLMRDRFPVAGRAPDVRARVLVVHGLSDDLIGPRHGEALARAFEAETYFVEGAGHNDLLSVAGAAYADRIEAFTRSVATSPRRP